MSTNDLVTLARSCCTDNPGLTHWEGCERHHFGCLIQRMADEIERLSRLAAVLDAAQAVLKAASDLNYCPLCDSGWQYICTDGCQIRALDAAINLAEKDKP